MLIVIMLGAECHYALRSVIMMIIAFLILCLKLMSCHYAGRQIFIATLDVASLRVIVVSVVVPNKDVAQPFKHLHFQSFLKNTDFGPSKISEQ